MKLSKETLKQIIKEELQKVMNESMSSSDLVYKIEKLVFSGREGYNQAEAFVDYALPMMNSQDAEYIDAIFQAGKVQQLGVSLDDEIKDSLKDGTYEENQTDFHLRSIQISEKYFGAMDKIEDIKGKDVRHRLHRIFRSF